MREASPAPSPASSNPAFTDARVDANFPGGELVVDLGCGDGAWIESVRSRYTRAVGIDIDDTASSLRGGSVAGWEFVQMDMNAGALPLPDGAADGVRANQVIEHVANPLHFVMEAWRVLRPGGVFVATTPNIRYLRHIGKLVIEGRGPLTSGAELRNPEVWDDGHVHFFTARDLEWLARAGGFSRVHTAALISLTGRGGSIRRALDRMSSRQLVKGFLSGNVMLAAWK